MPDWSDPGIPECHPQRTFESQRAWLMAISHRILGTVFDAEDVLQNAWLRWSKIAPDSIENPRAFLTTVVTRLSLDRLRRLKAGREVHFGPWVPEPVADDIGPQDAVERADSLSRALLVVLQRLSPPERAAFVLREAFGEPYPAIAQTLDRSEAAVRQLVHRARQHIDQGVVRYRADGAIHVKVVEGFTRTCLSGDYDELLHALAPDVASIGVDGAATPHPSACAAGRRTAVAPRTRDSHTLGREILHADR